MPVPLSVEVDEPDYEDKGQTVTYLGGEEDETGTSAQPEFPFEIDVDQHSPALPESLSAERAGTKLEHLFPRSEKRKVTSAIYLLMEHGNAIEKYLGAVEKECESDKGEVARLLAPHAENLRTLVSSYKTSLTRLEAVLEIADPQYVRSQGYNVPGPGVVGFGLQDVAAASSPVVAKVRFLSSAHRIKARDILERSGGYTRYRDDVFGIRSKKQLRKLRWRRIPYEVVQ